jgi:hypothetical protein
MWEMGGNVGSALATTAKGVAITFLPTKKNGCFGLVPVPIHRIQEKSEYS